MDDTARHRRPRTHRPPPPRPAPARAAPRPAEGRVRGQQAEEAPAPAGRRGDRRLRPDRAARPRDGLRVRRQGQLRPARHPADAQGARAVPVRGDRGEPRPEAAGLSRRRAAALPRGARRPVPHRRAGHLQRRQARHPRGRHDVLAVLAPAPRRALPRRGRNRRDQDRARPPPRRPPRDVLPQSLLRRQAEDDAAEARLRRRPARRDPPARVRARARPRALRRAERVPDHSVQSVRLAGAPAAQAGHRDAARVGEEVPGPHRLDLQRARARSCRRT